MTEGRRATDGGATSEERGESRARDERARVRAYLDLWERRLVELALAGPGPDAAPRRPR